MERMWSIHVIPKNLDENVRLSRVVIDKETKTYISYITNDVALTTEVHLNNGRYEIVKRDNQQPVLYRELSSHWLGEILFPIHA